MVGCSVLGCKSRSERKINTITFHSFPSNTVMKAKWSNATGRQHWQPRKYSKICSIHFEIHSFIYKKKLVLLKPSSVPTKHIHTTLNLSKKSNVMREMGAKIPGRSKTRRPTCKCDLCGCTFLSIQALRTHQACLHPKTKRVAYKPKIEVIARRKEVPLKRTNVIKSAKLLKQVQKVEEKIPKSKVDNKESNSVRRSGFECPLCAKSFTVYFSAYRHIQNTHCVNDKGETVPPNSSSLIKPLFIEQCITCNAKVDTEQHTCKEILKNNDEGVASNQTCLGCHQQFKSVHTFENHINKEHSEDVEYFFFSDTNKFLAWKKNIETQMAANYLVMKDKENSQVFHCNHFTTSKTTLMSCPSSISTEVFDKGIQVAFYRKHYGHSTKRYNLPETYKNCVITSLMKSFDSHSETIINNSNKDMYLEFKYLMGNIVNEAAKVNLNNLRLLLGKALEMTLVLNSHKNDKEIYTTQTLKKLTDDEISKFFDEPQQNKRKLDHNDTDPKRIKTEHVAKIEPRIISKDDDTQNLLVPREETGVNNIIIKDVKSLADPAKLKQSLKSGDDNAKIPTKSLTHSPSSFSESYKNFVSENFGPPTETPRAKRREIMKTKIGQFKPNTVSTPKKKEADIKVAPMPRTNRYSLPKVNDIKYEVLERENDCNILLIKI